jgi:hypothetical protein
MISHDLIIDLFIKIVDELGEENGLTDNEKERIVNAFKMAYNNPYTNEREIFTYITQGLQE